MFFPLLIKKNQAIFFTSLFFIKILIFLWNFKFIISRNMNDTWTKKNQEICFCEDSKSFKFYFFFETLSFAISRNMKWHLDEKNPGH